MGEDRERERKAHLVHFILNNSKGGGGGGGGGAEARRWRARERKDFLVKLACDLKRVTDAYVMQEMVLITDFFLCLMLVAVDVK